MALIWAEGFIGAKALAPAWRDLQLAGARCDKATTNSPEEFVAAHKAKQDAQDRYDTLLNDATGTQRQLGQDGQSRTHVLIVGVGKYDSNASIPAVTTSIYGARAFAEWALTRFSKSDRPLGSVEFLTSPAIGQGEWTPSAEAAVKLGFAAPMEISGEAATFDNIQKAFDLWLERAGTCADNAAIWYFAGHGLFKSGPLLLPQDAQLPSKTKSVENLIDPAATLYNMQNQKPSVQCFFIDACSESSLDLIYNQQQQPGRPLHMPSNGAVIPRREATIFFGSYAGGKAYGPAEGPPYFTQELLLCLQRRGGDASFGGKQVTMNSLSTALKAAASHRAEVESNPGIMFSDTKPGVSSGGSGPLCDLPGPIEVLVQVSCMPKEAMSTAKLFVVDPDGQRLSRTAPRTDFWCTPVGRGDCTASAEFDPPTEFLSKPESFQPIPPVYNVTVIAR